MRVLITGITGFAGSHLAEYLLDRGDVEIYGCCRWRSRLDNLEDVARRGKLNLRALEGSLTDEVSAEEFAQKDAVNLIYGDLTDASSMRRLISVVRPDRIFHLAAQSYVPASWNAPAETFHVNVIGQIHLFEAVREAGLDPLIHIAGSSEEYGLVYPHEVPMKESNPLRPLSPYAVSKVAQEKLAWQYFKSYGLRTVVTRGFNHTGPRRGEVFSSSTFAKQIARIEAGQQEPVIWVGNLETQRDWTDVRDIVRGYWLALEKGEPGEVYNIGSGVPRTIREMLDALLALSRVNVEMRPDLLRMRPSDVPVLWADCSKFRAQTGWEPQIPFEQTMEDLLNYWRERV
ncbi:MAG: GDP-mannose 4,6-dehydratase [Anaerolineae bacterium]